MSFVLNLQLDPKGFHQKGASWLIQWSWNVQGSSQIKISLLANPQSTAVSSRWCYKQTGSPECPLICLDTWYICGTCLRIKRIVVIVGVGVAKSRFLIFSAVRSEGCIFGAGSLSIHKWKWKVTCSRFRNLDSGQSWARSHILFGIFLLCISSPTSMQLVVGCFIIYKVFRKSN